MKKPKILVTAFEPFGGECVNPALEAMKQMKEEIAGVSVIKLPIPTVYESSLALIHRAICEHQPNAVLSIGQAGGRSGITPERVAINLDDCSLPDNAGDVAHRPSDFCRRRYGLFYHTPREGDGAGHAGKRNPGCAFYDSRDPMCAIM